MRVERGGAWQRRTRSVRRTRESGRGKHDRTETFRPHSTSSTRSSRARPRHVEERIRREQRIRDRRQGRRHHRVHA